MELNHKKLVFLGDSITQGVGVSDPAQVYWRQVEKRTGAACVGYGISGTRIARQQQPTPEAAGYEYPFYSRVEQMDEDADIVVVFGGTNDWGHGDAPFGAMSDRTVDTFCGACHVLCEKLITRYPQATIVVMTPLHRVNETAPYDAGWRLRRDHPLSDYVEALGQIARYYSLPVLDLYGVSGLQPEVAAIRERYVPDGLHPNEAGHTRIADRLIAFLHTLE